MPTECWICGKPVHPPRRKYCSDACTAEARRRQKRTNAPRHHKAENPVWYDRPCIDCGKVVRMPLKSKRCPSCQYAADQAHTLEYRRRRDAGHSRKLGAMYPCERCGEPYILNSGLQRYCRTCAPSAIRANVNAAKRDERREALADPVCRERRNAKRRSGWQDAKRTCAVCGAEFAPINPRSTTCSPECQRIRKQRIQHAADARRAETRNAKDRAQRQARNAAMTPEELQRKRDEINARARANYARRKAEKEDTP